MNNKKKEDKEEAEVIVEESGDDPEKIQQEDKQNQEDAMEEMNKQMTFLMPAMTVSIALIAPLGLALYWLVSNLLTIGERIVLNNYIKEDEE